MSDADHQPSRTRVPMPVAALSDPHMGDAAKNPERTEQIIAIILLLAIVFLRYRVTGDLTLARLLGVDGGSPEGRRRSWRRANERVDDGESSGTDGEAGGGS